MRAALLIGLLAGCASQNPSATSTSSSAPRNYELVYEQTFETVDCLQDFDFSNPESWTWSRKESAMELVGVGSYEPEHRSPASLAILKGLKLGDFVLEAELKQTGRDYGHRDMCLFFGYVRPALFYYAHLAPAPDENAHNVFLVKDAPRTNLAPVFPEGMQWGEGWHTVRLVRRGAEVRVFVDDADQPTLRARDATIPRGRVGIGSFDDSGKIRSLKIWAPR